jgi:hypothetical protein
MRSEGDEDGDEENREVGGTHLNTSVHICVRFREAQ